jgi:hypothetical protein
MVLLLNRIRFDHHARGGERLTVSAATYTSL